MKTNKIYKKIPKFQNIKKAPHCGALSFVFPKN